MPLSFTAMRSRPWSSLAVVTSIKPPSGVNLVAFLMIDHMTCWSRAESAFVMLAGGQFHRHLQTPGTNLALVHLLDLADQLMYVDHFQD